MRSADWKQRETHKETKPLPFERTRQRTQTLTTSQNPKK